MQSSATAAEASVGRGERRYLGYRAADAAQPYAKYMRERVEPAQPHVIEAAAGAPLPTESVPLRSGLAAELSAPGYTDFETGYGRTGRGELRVACFTDLPRNTPEMWDWWFGWHGKESARYKLWHPEAHAYSALRDDRSDQPGLTDRERFRGNVSYVDEYIGDSLDQLAISFVEPARFGFDEAAFDGTLICAYVGSAYLPVNVGLVTHAIRRTPTGAEMRSRFYLNVPGLRRVDRTAVGRAISRGLVPPGRPIFPVSFGAKLLLHCGEEMHHLAGFLPELYAEFG